MEIKQKLIIQEKITMINLPIGLTNFRKLIEYKHPANGKGFLFVDKSEFIKDIVYDSSKVIAITRPRRFGKTLNLSMLQHFYSPELENKPTAHLFENLAIAKHPNCMKKQGKYPVIFITLKDVKEVTFEKCLNYIKTIISETYKSFREALYSNKIPQDEKNYITSIINKTADEADFKISLKKLHMFLYTYYGVKPILLMDEYDTPIQEAYINNYYAELMPFYRGLLSAALKDNDYLEKGVLTGILRISKESIFSDLNNVKVHSILSNKYAKWFGFTETEVIDLFKATQLEHNNIEQVKDWFNGYTFGGETVYNPWSIINCLEEEGKLKPYWINTSGNKLIKDLVIKGNATLKKSMASLLAGKSIFELIDEHVVFADLESNINTVWSLFLFSGYLKVISLDKKEDYDIYELKIPNKEIKNFYCSIIRNWLTEKIGMHWYQEFLSSLTAGNIEQFAKKLQELTIQSLSYHDATISNQENFYHGLVLGLVVGLKDTHDIKSNRESGYGRYDLMIIPKDKNKLGIVIEFKAVTKDIELDEAAIAAYQQIIKSEYITELTALGIANICKMGIAFSGKAIQVKGS